MFQPINHKPGLSVAILLMLALFMQLLAPPVATVIANTAKTESATNTGDANNANATETTLSVRPQPQPAPTVAPNAPAVPTITATLSDGIPLASKANPGDTITYTATITNSGTDASAVVYTDVLDNNTTLVGGSVKTTPIAFNDSYSAIGNVRIQPNAAAGVLVNDIDPDTGNNTGLTAVAATTSSTQCAACNNVSVNADGSFSYNPPVGFTGSDTFIYTVTDTSGKTGTGTVTITVSGMVWFI